MNVSNSIYLYSLKQGAGRRIQELTAAKLRYAHLWHGEFE